MDEFDDEGYVTITDQLSFDQKTFDLKLESSRTMQWPEVLLAIADWLNDEAKKLKKPTDDDGL